MRQVDSVRNEVKAISILAAVIIAMACSALQGCAVPALLGVKSYQSGDTRIEFITGADIGFSMNGVDSVSNSRGISPEGGAQTKARKVEAKY